MHVVGSETYTYPMNLPRTCSKVSVDHGGPVVAFSRSPLLSPFVFLGPRWLGASLDGEGESGGEKIKTGRFGPREVTLSSVNSVEKSLPQGTLDNASEVDRGAWCW